MITGVYAAIAALAFVYLSMRVIRIRRGKGISVGPAGDPELERAIRVQGNFIEYAPITLLLLFIAEQNGLAGLATHLLGLLFLAGRLIHFRGFRSADAPGRLRVAGMVITFTVLGILATITIIQYMLELTA